jgi:hypothetical protein
MDVLEQPAEIILQWQIGDGNGTTLGEQKTSEQRVGSRAAVSRWKMIGAEESDDSVKRV